VPVGSDSDPNRLLAESLAFCDGRDPHRFHMPRNPAASVVIEVAGRRENTQSSRDGEELCAARQGSVSKEMADILYLVTPAHILGVDATEATRAKMASNVDRFPIEGANGRAWSNEPEWNGLD
jgi:dCTP diphosphatase